MADRMKEALGCTDEEWKALQPKIEKVQTLSRQARGFGGMGLRPPGGSAGPGGPGQSGGPVEPTVGAAPGSQLTEVEQKSQDLLATLNNKDAKPQEIKQKLTALREAREKVRQELATAQDELREVLTASQEAQLVLMGLLD